MEKGTGFTILFSTKELSSYGMILSLTVQKGSLTQWDLFLTQAMVKIQNGIWSDSTGKQTAIPFQSPWKLYWSAHGKSLLWKFRWLSWKSFTDHKYPLLWGKHQNRINRGRIRPIINSPCSVFPWSLILPVVVNRENTGTAHCGQTAK